MPKERKRQNSTRRHASGKRLSQVQAGQKTAFLDAFRVEGTILHAAIAAEVGRTTVYEWLKSDSEFAAAFRIAVDDYTDKIEREAFRRAVEGYDEPMFGQVQQLVDDGNGRKRAITSTAVVGVLRKYSDKLLEALLRGNRREKYNTRQHEITGKDGAPLVIEPSKLTNEQLQQVIDLLRATGEGEP